MSSFNGIAVLSIPATITSSPFGISALPWNGGSTYYQWLVTLSITQQTQSSLGPRAPLFYDGMDVNVGQWIADIGTGLAWQIVSISGKTSTSVTCVVEDIFRYNTYRDPSQSGSGDLQASNYVIFKVADDGTPLIDPVPVGASANFFTSLVTRFSYIDSQFDFILQQPNYSVVTFPYNSLIAFDTATSLFVLADNAHPYLVGRVTGVDDTGVNFAVSAISKVIDGIDSLPGNVGELLYVDNANPGKLTTSGTVPVYLKVRANTQSSSSSSAFASAGAIVTTPGFTFNVNGHLATVGGTGALSDVNAAINSVSSTSGVSSFIVGGGPVHLQITAIDARAINFTDVIGGPVTDAGLISAENGIKAAAIFVTGSGNTSVALATTTSFGIVKLDAPVDDPLNPLVLTHGSTIDSGLF